jgi:hypothetical protein
MPAVFSVLADPADAAGSRSWLTQQVVAMFFSEIRGEVWLGRVQGSAVRLLGVIEIKTVM